MSGAVSHALASAWLAQTEHATVTNVFTAPGNT